MQRFPFTVGVIGGAGHVGLPFALSCAEAGLPTVIYDLDRRKLDQIRAGVMPFLEDGAEAALVRALASGHLAVEDRPGVLSDCRFLVMVIGTPVDEYLNPKFGDMDRAVAGTAEHVRDGQILILRSTVFPGTSDRLRRHLEALGRDVRVACCPERVSQGHALRELRELPQIISAFDPETMDEVRGFFSRLAPELIEMTPIEAELCKLMTNSWRYIQFATVNQFYMLANDCGADFDRILHGCRHNYPRMVGMPGPGLAAGPCLMKDTMQLASFSHNRFVLGHAAMLINEGLPAYLIDMARAKVDLTGATAGILGMAFKAESDDPRDSLSYKLRKLLRLEARRVLCTDPFIADPSFVALETVLEEADLLFVAAPHHQYRGLSIRPGTTVIDVWGVVA